MHSLRRNLPRLALATALALLVSATVAFADISRDEYTAQVEPICKTNSNANKRILKGIRQDVKKKKYARAGRKLMRASKALAKAKRQIAAVEQPTADARKLGQWLKHIGQQVTTLRKMGKYAKAGNKRKLSSYNSRLHKQVSQANNSVVGFGFKYCLINPSRYT